MGHWERFRGLLGPLGEVSIAFMEVFPLAESCSSPLANELCPSRRLAAKCVLVFKFGEAFVVPRGGECAIFFRSIRLDSGDVSGVWFGRYGGERLHRSSAHYL